MNKITLIIAVGITLQLNGADSIIIKNSSKKLTGVVQFAAQKDGGIIKTVSIPAGTTKKTPIPDKAKYILGSTPGCSLDGSMYTASCEMAEFSIGGAGNVYSIETMKKSGILESMKKHGKAYTINCFCPTKK